jgi:hypothetical protein
VRDVEQERLASVRANAHAGWVREARRRPDIGEILTLATSERLPPDGEEKRTNRADFGCLISREKDRYRFVAGRKSKAGRSGSDVRVDTRANGPHIGGMCGSLVVPGACPEGVTPAAGTGSYLNFT